MTKTEELRKEKAKQLRYKKPIVKDLNIWQIREELDEISCECDEVRYYTDSDDDSLINALDGDEDEAYEFKMAFADLCSECDRMREDLDDEFIPECFDLLFVAVGAGDYGNGLLGWDSYEQDYFGIGLGDGFIKGEAAQKLKQLTKDQIIECVGACLKVLYAYLGLRYRYDSLKSAMDILRNENTGILKVAKHINEAYISAEEDSIGFRFQTDKVRELEKMFEALPPETWIQ